MPRALAFFLFLLFSAAEGFPQADAGAAATPFVTRLKAAAADTQVKLTWKDPPDARGDALVYRHTQEITDATFTAARLVGRVSLGVEYYVDTPPDPRGYYYAVIVQGPEDAARKVVLIPFRNKTSFPVAVQTTATEEQLAARVTGIKASVTPDGNTIELAFHSARPDRDLLVFWGTSPLRTAEDLLRGTSKTSLDPGVQSYRVPVIPGVGYFFAVLDAGLYKVGKAPLAAGQNATTSAVEIPLRAAGIGIAAPAERRPFPLPALRLTRAVESGRDLPGGEPFALPSPKAVSPATENAISKLLAEIHDSAEGEIAVQKLESDRTPAVGGELAALQTIVTGPLAAGKFPEAETLLRNFLSIPRSREVEAHARFYLGQILYFREMPRDAVMEFLLAEDALYRDTRPWLNACFRALTAAEAGAPGNAPRG